jgi:acetyltransferase
MDAQTVVLRDGRTAVLRPARPADRDAVQQFVRGLSPSARRRRFFGPVAELAPDQLDRVTRVCLPEAFALVAVDATAAVPRIVALAQYALEDGREAEFAVVVADDWQRLGLGKLLLEALLSVAAAAGVHAMNGLVMAENWPMLGLAAAAGFDLEDGGDPHTVSTRKRLSPAQAGGIVGWLANFVQRATRGLEVAPAP